MRRYKTAAVISYLFVVFTFVVQSPNSSFVQAQVLLQDDFNDNSFDATKWFARLPFGNSAINEQNQRMEFQNRAYLVTQSQFDPSAHNGLLITADWTFTNATFPGHDFLRVLTRTSATPTGGFAEASDGIAFTINGNDVLSIEERNTGNVLGTTALHVDDNDTFRLTAFDDGFNLWISAQEIGGQGDFAFLSATSSFVPTANHVAFYNREHNNGFATLGFLDNVTISSIPEPSSVFLFALVIGPIVLGRGRQILRCRL